eukprot:8254929-Heterocapsa_arctica.AAC.1
MPWRAAQAFSPDKFKQLGSEHALKAARRIPQICPCLVGCTSSPTAALPRRQISAGMDHLIKAS